MTTPNNPAAVSERHRKAIIELCPNTGKCDCEDCLQINEDRAAILARHFPDNPTSDGDWVEGAANELYEKDLLFHDEIETIIRKYIPANPVPPGFVRREVLEKAVAALRHFQGKDQLPFGRQYRFSDEAEAELTALPVICEQCGKNPATCRGAYEGAENETLACDECCGHGNEDGHCKPLQSEQKDALLVRREILENLTDAIDSEDETQIMSARIKAQIELTATKPKEGE